MAFSREKVAVRVHHVASRHPHPLTFVLGSCFVSTDWPSSRGAGGRPEGTVPADRRVFRVRISRPGSATSRQVVVSRYQTRWTVTDPRSHDRTGPSQVLDRQWKLAESFAASFCAMNFIGATRSIFFLGMLAGGPVAMWSMQVVGIILMCSKSWPHEFRPRPRPGADRLRLFLQSLPPSWPRSALRSR